MLAGLLGISSLILFLTIMISAFIGIFFLPIGVVILVAWIVFCVIRFFVKRNNLSPEAIQIFKVYCVEKTKVDGSASDDPDEFYLKVSNIPYYGPFDEMPAEGRRWTVKVEDREYKEIAHYSPVYIARYPYGKITNTRYFGASSFLKDVDETDDLVYLKESR